MNENLAERLLANIMKWEPSDVARERPILQSLAAFKYDDYEPFSPGMRFIESLALWLKQFQTLEERKTAYEFVRRKLLFVSPKEMYHLVTIAYPDYIRPFLIKMTSLRTGIPEWNVVRIANSLEFKVLKRQSLFLALSDGAHIDEFRRSNPSISNEQVLRTHEIPAERAREMIAELRTDFTNLLCREPESEETKFRCVFLLDDFSGSGLSYINRTDSNYSGKIWKFHNIACTENSNIRSLFDLDDLHVCLLLYVASSQACTYLKTVGRSLFNKVPFEVLVVCPLPDSIKIDEQNDESFVKILKKYFDPTVVDKHFVKGRHDKPYLGFNEGALPLVLSHNAPNNSVSILWLPENRRYRGLFPRVSRHREEV